MFRSSFFGHGFLANIRRRRRSGDERHRQNTGLRKSGGRKKTCRSPTTFSGYGTSLVFLTKAVRLHRCRSGKGVDDNTGQDSSVSWSLWRTGMGKRVDILIALGLPLLTLPELLKIRRPIGRSKATSAISTEIVRSPMDCAFD